MDPVIEFSNVKRKKKLYSLHYIEAFHATVIDVNVPKRGKKRMEHDDGKTGR